MKSAYLNCRSIQPPVKPMPPEDDIECCIAWFDRIVASRELMEKLGITYKKMPYPTSK